MMEPIVDASTYPTPFPGRPLWPFLLAALLMVACGLSDSGLKEVARPAASRIQEPDTCRKVWSTRANDRVWYCPDPRPPAPDFPQEDG